MKIRKATLNDVPRIVELWVEFFEEHNRLYTRDDPIYQARKNKSQIYKECLTKNIRRRNAAVFVADKSGDLVGYLVVEQQRLAPFQIHDKEAYVSELFVEKKSRREGIGTMLLDAANSWAKEKDLFSIGLIVNTKNKKAYSAYLKNGFKGFNLKMSKIVK